MQSQMATYNNILMGVEAMVRECDENRSRLDKLTYDYENEKESRRQLQRALREAEYEKREEKKIVVSSIASRSGLGAVILA
jgi:hypothetical protein